MYVRVISFETKSAITPGQAKELYESVVKVLEGMEGYLGSSLFLNEETKHGLSMTYWIDRDHAIAGSEKSLPVLFERISDIVKRPPVITGYDVIDETRRGTRL